MLSTASLRVLAAACALLAAAPAFAQVSIPDEYEKHIQQSGAVTALGGDVAGDHVGLSNGALEITQTDVDLPGNNALSVRLARRFKPNEVYLKGHFNDWDLDIPHAHGTFGNTSTGSGWIVDIVVANKYKRCSKFGPPPPINNQGGTFDSDEFWSGTYFYLPGSGDQELLSKPLVNAHVPTDGNTYPIVTREGSVVRCVALASTSESGSQGEGFEVVTPDGVVYTLNHMVSRLESTLNKSEPTPMLMAGGEESSASEESTTSAKSIITPNVAVNYVLPRKEYLLYPTKATDRYGNTVTYTWSTTNPWQLTQILASDGRHLDFTYQSSTSVLVTSVTDGAHTWQYGYGGAWGELISATLPDATGWSYSLHSLRYGSPHALSSDCDVMTPSGNTYTGSITSPSGATVQYTLAALMAGRSWVQRECIADLSSNSHAREPYLYTNLALTSKKITGPGLPAAGLIWTYNYGPTNQCWDPYSAPGGTILCTGSSPTTRTTTVTDPASGVTRYTFGNRFEADEGMLLVTDSGWNGTSALSTQTITYAYAGLAPYYSYNGNTIRHMGDYDVATLYRPQRKVVTVQQGRTFTWEVANDCGGLYCFDTFARPTKVIKSSVNP